MANNGGKGFILAAKFYKSAKYTDIMAPNNRKLQWKSVVYPEGTAAKNQ